MSDSFGLDIANVKLDRCGESSIIKNGDFSNNCLGKATWGYFKGGIPGWKANNAELGICHNYNTYWPNNGQVCLELDSDTNQRYIQVVRR